MDEILKPLLSIFESMAKGQEKLNALRQRKLQLEIKLLESQCYDKGMRNP